MSGSASIERARNASELLRCARDQMPVLNGTTTSSDDGMVTVNLDLLGHPSIVVDRDRTYSYEEYEVKMIIIDTYNRAIQTRTQQVQEAASKASEVLETLARTGRE